jgi:hypothetical protein
VTALDQNTVRVLSGASAFDSLSPADAQTVVDAIESRLMLALCMDEAPIEEQELSLWKQLLSTAIVIFSNLDYDGVTSERVRNYSYTLSQDAGTWSNLRKHAGDLLCRFNNCSLRDGISMQTDITWIQYSKLGECLRFPIGGAL